MRRKRPPRTAPPSPSRVTDAFDPEIRIQRYLERTGLGARHPRIVPLTGDASDRRYVRVLVPGEPSLVLALYGAPFDPADLPFIHVADLLARVPIPVPAIVDQAGDLGIVALEDLGDVTLQAYLGAASPEQRAARYREAISLLVLLQRRGAELASPQYLPYRIAFDIEKLSWELDYFVRHFLEAYRGAVLSPAVREALQGEFAAIVEELAAEPRVLCHRDYHSRNLMWHHGRLYVIDFQDARMGPDTYDLVSLLRDSYVDLPEDLVETLVTEYLVWRGQDDRDRFRRRFDLMALQRNLKALGTFGYQTTARGNPVYIQYIPRTLRYVRATLARHRRFGRLHEVLAGVLEELR
jgi:aminoglycoside/choline kinase family phosphotransferase